MNDGGFETTNGNLNKKNESEKPKDIIIPLLNKQILEAIRTIEDETVKIDGVFCQNFVCVG